MGDMTDDKNESSHEMKDNEDDPPHMGDENHQHDEHDDNDDNKQAIATCTQAQLARLVEHVVSNAISQERTNFHSQITKKLAACATTSNDYYRYRRLRTTNPWKHLPKHVSLLPTPNANKT
jgi:hypothetical protein